MKEIGRIKKIWLFINVASYKFAKDNTKSATVRDRSISIGLFYLFEFSLIDYINEYVQPINRICFTILVIIPLVFHSLIDIIYLKDIEVIGNNYDLYYKKAYYYIYLFLIVIGVVYMIYYFFNR
jgi:hypothetical protein